MKRFTYVIDIDDTLSITPRDENNVGQYSQSKPILKVVKKIQKLHKQGHKIILFTARGMRTFDNDVDKIIDAHGETLTQWLEENQVPYDELIFGKPWGPNVFYVDDRALTINQFLSGDSSEYHKDYLKTNNNLV